MWVLGEVPACGASIPDDNRIAPKLETQNKKEDQISTPHPPDNAESEVFSEVRVPGVRFFGEKVTLYGEVTIKNRYLETKPLKFSPPQIVVRDRGK